MGFVQLEIKSKAEPCSQVIEHLRSNSQKWGVAGTVSMGEGRRGKGRRRGGVSFSKGPGHWGNGRLGLFPQASPLCPPISCPQTAQIHPGCDPDEGALSHGPLPLPASGWAASRSGGDGLHQWTQAPKMEGWWCCGVGGPAWELNLQLYPGGERVSCSWVPRALVGLGFQGLGSPPPRA